MIWRLLITIDAERAISKLDSPIRKRVQERLSRLVMHFNEIHPLPLGGVFRGFCKLRVGDWRIVYEIRESSSEIIVHLVDRRDKIYKR